MEFFDLAKAFDCVNNEILLSKLHHCGVQSVSINWFRSYLLNKKKRMELKIQSAGVYYSNCETVKHGVPQGSVLGPQSIIVYVSELPLKTNTISDTIPYTDDTSFIIATNNMMILNRCQILLCPTCVIGLMSVIWFFNVEKKNALKFTTT